MLLLMHPRMLLTFVTRTHCELQELIVGGLERPYQSLTLTHHMNFSHAAKLLGHQVGLANGWTHPLRTLSPATIICHLIPCRHLLQSQSTQVFFLLTFPRVLYILWSCKYTGGEWVLLLLPEGTSPAFLIIVPDVSFSVVCTCSLFLAAWDSDFCLWRVSAQKLLIYVCCDLTLVVS